MSNNSSNNLNFMINVDGNAFFGVTQLNTQVNELTEAIGNQVGTLTKWGETTSALNSIFDFTKTVISSITSAVGNWENAYLTQASVETKLAQVMRSTMEASNAEIESVKQLADAQQKLGIVSSGVQLAGAQELSTYLSKSESLRSLMPVMNDLIAQQYGYSATQEQATQIASMMGKVMGGQIDTLSQYGYRFTEAQEKLLKYGDEQQRVATLAEVVTSTVGGMNGAMAQTSEGKLRQQANAMSDIAIQAGKVYVGVKAALLPMFEWVNQKLESLVGWFDANFEAISAICKGVAVAITVAFDVVFFVMGTIIGVFVWLWDIIRDGLPVVAGLGTAIAGYTVAVNWAAIQTTILTTASTALSAIKSIATIKTMALTAATWAWNAALSANPIGIVVGLVAGLVATLVVCWQMFAKFRAFIKSMWDTIKGFGDIIKTYVLDRITGLLNGIGNLGQAIGKLFKGDFSGAWQSAKEGATQIMGVDAAKKAVSNTRELMGSVKDTYSERLAEERAKETEKKTETTGIEPDGDAALAAMVLPSINNPIGEAMAGIGHRAEIDPAGKNKTINVTIDKVVDNFTINTTNLQEDTSKIKQLVADTLIDAVNDINYTFA